MAALPDVHFEIGATVGSVIPTKGAIIPTAAGVDIGCGMMAVKTSSRDKKTAHVNTRNTCRADLDFVAEPP